MTTAFVAGATGYTGRAVVRELVARGVTTIAHVRPDSRSLESTMRELGEAGARVDTTPWDEARLASTLAQHRPDVIFALLGTTRARGKKALRETGKADTYASVDYGLTAMLLRSTRAAGLESRFVYLSALGAGRPSANPYFAARYRLETELRASGLPFVIARPSFITGPDRAEPRAGERIAATVVDGALHLARGFGARRLAAKYGSMTATELGKALVVLGLTSERASVVVDTEALRAGLG